MENIKTNLPNESRKYTFIQIEMDGDKYLWFGACGHAYTMTLLLEGPGDRCTLRNGRPYSSTLDKFLDPDERRKTYQTMPDPLGGGLKFTPSEIPKHIGDGYELIGAGRADIDCESKKINLHDRSMSYNIGINEAQISLFKQQNPDWNFHG